MNSERERDWLCKGQLKFGVRPGIKRVDLHLITQQACSGARGERSRFLHNTRGKRQVDLNTEKASHAVRKSMLVQ